VQPDRFDWTITGIDNGGRRLVWGVECSWCGWTRPLPGVERLEIVEQNTEIERVSTEHARECVRPMS